MMNNLDIIKEKLDALELASELTKLRRTGQSYKGLCPFHDEKTPSFHVWPKKNRFKCFGCGKYGSGIDLYMHIHNLTFPEAVRKLELEMSLTSTLNGPIMKFCPLKSQDFQALSLHPKSMRTLYEEDREAFYYIIDGKIREEWVRWTNIFSHPAVRDWKPEYKALIQKKKDYFWNLWFQIVKDKEEWRTKAS